MHNFSGTFCTTFILPDTEALSLILSNKRYDELSREDYKEANFTANEIETLQEIYFSLILHSRKNKIEECISFIDEALLNVKGYVAPIDVLMEIGDLPKSDYENWRRGKVRYLEQVIKMNLRKINLCIKEINRITENKKLKPSKTVYYQWGKKMGIRLQFSKSGAKHLEELYSTHYISGKLRR